MLSIGLATRVDEIVAPLRRPVWVLRALVASFVLTSVVVVAMAWGLPLDPAYELGLMLLAFAAGSPLLPGTGAAVGAAAAGGQSRRQNAAAAGQAQQQQQATAQQQQQYFSKARPACLEGRGYTVK
jgi:hypothetical protein